jgi:hypothetical protein
LKYQLMRNRLSVNRAGAPEPTSPEAVGKVAARTQSNAPPHGSGKNSLKPPEIPHR